MEKEIQEQIKKYVDTKESEKISLDYLKNILLQGAIPIEKDNVIAAINPDGEFNVHLPPSSEVSAYQLILPAMYGLYNDSEDFRTIVHGKVQQILVEADRFNNQLESANGNS